MRVRERHDIFRQCEISYAIRAISEVLKDHSEGSQIDMEAARPGLHCALAVLSEELQDFVESGLDNSVPDSTDDSSNLATA